MAAPFKIWLSYTAYYPNPPTLDIDNYPIVTDEVYTEITTVYDNNLTLSRARDIDLSYAAIRTKLTGDFTIGGTDFDSIETALAAGFNELIIKIEQYSEIGTAYVEVYRGLVKIRGALDIQRSRVKLSNFTGIDFYSDIERELTQDWKYEMNFNYAANEGLFFNYSAADNYIPGMEEISVQIFTNQYSKKVSAAMPMSWTNDGITTLYVFGLSDDAAAPKALWIGEGKRAKDGSATADGITLSKKDVFDLFYDLFQLCIELVNPYTLSANESPNKIHLRHIPDLVASGTVDYTTESADFQKITAIDKELVVFEKWNLAPAMNILGTAASDHSSSMYEYNVLSILETIVSQTSVFTNVPALVDNPDSILDGNKILGIANKQAANQWELDTIDPGITTANKTYNAEVSQAVRMRDWLNNYRQLDEAYFNSAIPAALKTLNPIISKPLFTQEPFPVDFDLITDIDFSKFATTSVGQTTIKTATVNLKTNFKELVCEK